MSTVEFKNGSINIISHEVRNEFPVDVSGTGSRVSSGDDVNLALAGSCLAYRYREQVPPPLAAITVGRGGRRHVS